jgi:hypothetical protein
MLEGNLHRPTIQIRLKNTSQNSAQKSEQKESRLKNLKSIELAKTEALLEE